MLCEKCNKNNATVHFQQNVNGQQTEYHLCNECAAELNILNMQPTFSNMFDGFLNSFLNSDNFIKTSQITNHICPTCSSTINDIKNTGRLGCADCYTTFADYLEGVLKNIQFGNNHTGKIPKKAGGEIKTKREIENLKIKLAKAVENEEYEEAAKLRDRIKELEKE